MDLWDFDETVDALIDVPDWIDSDITGTDIAAICQGGCSSGAYMPAVTYGQASETMAEFGDEVLEYLEHQYGELPTVPDGTSWSGMAVFFLSCAVEAWARNAEAQLEEALDFQEEEDEDGDYDEAA